MDAEPQTQTEKIAELVADEVEKPLNNNDNEQINEEKTVVDPIKEHQSNEQIKESEPELKAVKVMADAPSDDEK